MEVVIAGGGPAVGAGLEVLARLGVGDDVEAAGHPAVLVAGDGAEHLVLAEPELAERQVDRVARLHLRRRLAEDRQRVHLRVDVGDPQRHLAGRRHDVLRLEHEGTEVDLDDRLGRCGTFAAATASVAAAADAAQGEEAEDERAEREDDGRPAEERAVFSEGGARVVARELRGRGR